MANKMITLKSSNGENFQIEESVAKQSKTIQQMIEVDSDDAVIEVDYTNTIIPLQITSDVLIKIIEYCERHVAADENSKSPEIYPNQPSSSSESSSSVSAVDELKIFDQNFVKVDWDLLMDIVDAANFLEIKNLFHLTCQAAADYIKDKTPEEVRILFGVENDFTPEEEEEIRRENAWTFE